MNKERLLHSVVVWYTVTGEEADPMSYSIIPITKRNRQGMKQVEALLTRSGLRLDTHLDYTCAMLDSDGSIAATGSCFGNTLRCIAVSGERQGEGLLGPLLTHLIQVQYDRGNYHLFLYTKSQTAKYFRDFGFHEIAQAGETMTFMENRKTGFSRYLDALGLTRREGQSAAIVMNANPFTLGHLHLAERAASENDTVHIFVVSEDASEFPFAVRWRLVQEGTAHLSNVVCHESGPYIISSATFPSYFLPDAAAAAEGQARLDLTVFCRIAQALGVTRRYVGEEPVSQVTNLYNTVMASELPKAGIACIVVPRREWDSGVISASTVRRCLREGRMEELERLVPPSTLAYLRSAQADWEG